MNEKQVAAWKALCNSYARLVGNLEQNGTLSGAEVEEVMDPVSEFWERVDAEEFDESESEVDAESSSVLARSQVTGDD